MTRAVHREFRKDEATSVGFPLSDHLRNHVHLTNCIHLKNHMHRHSPILSERSLMRDLVMLQRSRSLRDPSASPSSSWISPLVASTLGRNVAKDGSVHSGRRSIGVDRRRESGAGRLSVSSPRAAPSVATSKVAAAEMSNVEEEICKGKEDGRRIHKSKGKMISEQLEEAPSQTDNESRWNSGQCRHRREKMEEDIAEEPEVSGHVYCTGLKRMKRRRFRGARRAHGSVDPRGVGTQNDPAVDTKLVAQGPAHGKHFLGDG